MVQEVTGLSFVNYPITQFEFPDIEV